MSNTNVCYILCIHFFVFNVCLSLCNNLFILCYYFCRVVYIYLKSDSLRTTLPWIETEDWSSAAAAALRSG